MAKLGEIIEQIRGVSYTPLDLHKELNNNAVTLLRATNIQNNQLNFDELLYIDKEKADPKQYLKSGDILVCTSSGSKELVGKAVFIEKDLNMVFGAFCKVIRPKTEHKKYIGYFFQSPYYRNYISAVSAGANINNLRIEHFSNLEIPLPPLEEQQKIAAVLDKVTDLIDKRKQQLTKLDELIKSRFVEMFGDISINQNKFLTLSLQSLIDQNFITYHLDGNHGGDYPRNEEFTQTGIPYIGANCIDNGKINFSNAKYLPEERANKLKKGIAQNGDVLFAHNATVGPVALLTTSEKKIILSTSLTAYRCNLNFLNPYYLRSYMESTNFIQQYILEMKQTTRNQIPITAQRKYFFIVPPLDLQNQFAEFVEQTEKTKVAINHSLDKLETLKKALMQKYFG